MSLAEKLPEICLKTDIEKLQIIDIIHKKTYRYL